MLPLNYLLAGQPFEALASLLAIIIAITVHEFSHAFVAMVQGDSTAELEGRVTFNPLSHIDFFGLFALIFLGFGWGKPVPFNPYLLRDQKWGPLYIGLAGPFSNLLMLSLVGILLRLLLPVLGPNNLLILFLGLCFLINTALMLFNLIPLPPLDGSKIIMALLHKPKWFAFREKLESYGSWILMGLILLDVVFGIGLISAVLGGPYHWVAGLFGLNGLFGL